MKGLTFEQRASRYLGKEETDTETWENFSAQPESKQIMLAHIAGMHEALQLVLRYLQADPLESVNKAGLMKVIAIELGLSDEEE